MKGFKSTSTNPYTYTQDGVWKKGQYTFQAVVLSDSGYAFAFQRSDTTWQTVDLSWQVKDGSYSKIQWTFTLELDAVAFRLIANTVTGETIVLQPMLEKGSNGSTPIAHEEDLRGMDGDNHEFIFTRNTTGIPPATPLSTQDDDYVPEDWTDNAQGVTSEIPFEFVSMRERKNGVWLDFSPPSLWAKWGEDGLSVNLLVEGHYKSHWEGITKVVEIVGGVDVGGNEVVKVSAVFRKGEENIAATVSQSRGFQWYVNGVHLTAFDNQPFITLDETYGDGFADYVVLSYLVNSIREEERREIINISEGMDGIGEEFIFKANNSDTVPPVLPQTTDVGYQDDDYYGQGTANEWNDDPVAPTELNQFVWVAKRKKIGGIWEAFGTPSIWTKWVEDGSDAKSLILSASSLTMKCNPDNTPQTGQTISIEAKLQNVSGTATFVATPYNDAGTALTAITLGGSGNTRTLTNAQWLATYKRIEVVATLGSLSDTVTITRLSDGDPGDPGEDGYSVSLSKTEHTFNYDKNGNLKGILSDGTIFVEVLNGFNPLICDSIAASPPYIDGTYRVTDILISPSTTLSYNVDRQNNIYRIIPTMIDAEEVMVTFTIVARAKGINTTFTRQLKYQKSHDGADGTDGEDGTDGTDGDSVVHIYKQYPTKPATPSSGVANPTGWSRNPDYILSIVSQTNWTVNGKWHQSEELTAIGNSSTSRITFTTYKDAQTITLELWADGHATYDYVYAGNLDTSVSTSNYYDRVRGGRIIITYDVPTAGNHYIDIFWRKGIATVVGSNRGYYAIISDVKVWRSVTSVIGGVVQAWSEPQQFFIDSVLEERIYCLSKTTTAPIISDSDAYINDYIPLPCSLSSYRGDFTTNRAYSIGQVVIYQFEYYKVVKTITSASTRYPTDEEYFEKIPGWTDNPVGANKDYPFEFVAIRKKQSDGLWGQFVPSVWSKWGANGHSPYIDETTNTWWTWDEELGIYTDTGMSPVGSDGAIPYPAGYYDNTKWYRREAEYAPYVQYEGALYLLIKDTPNEGIPTTNTEFWKAFNHWQAVFVDSLVAAFAKIGGAVFTGDTTGTSSGIRGRLISETGVKSGADNTNYSEYVGDSGAWIPKMMLDFLTGAAYFGAKKIMFNPDGSGYLANQKVSWNANGDTDYQGTLTGVSGSFKTLNCVNEYGNTVGTIKFGTDGRIWFENCSIAHQAATGPFLGSDMWVRGAFGAFEKTAIRILGSYGYVYAEGLSGSSEYLTFTQKTDTGGNTYYDIPLYSPTTQSSGCPIDIVIINHNYSSAMNYNLQYIPGKTVVVVNSNDDNSNVYIYCNGARKQLMGGEAATFVCVGSFQTPDNSTGLGRGWFMSGKFDNDWN